MSQRPRGCGAVRQNPLLPQPGSPGGSPGQGRGRGEGAVPRHGLQVAAGARLGGGKSRPGRGSAWQAGTARAGDPRFPSVLPPASASHTAFSLSGSPKCGS